MNTLIAKETRTHARQATWNVTEFGSSDGGRRDCGDGLPAHGLYLRNVEQVSVRGLRVDCVENDGRPLIVQENCKGVNLTDCDSNQTNTSL